MTAPVKCRVSWWFHKRMLLVVLLLVGFAGYFLYDGFRGYPEDNRLVSQFEAFRADSSGESWEVFARRHGQSANIPQRHTEASIKRQKQLGFLGLGLVSIASIWWWLQGRKKWVVFPDGRFVTPDGLGVSFNEVESADFAKWNRGVAFLNCGEKGCIHLDDYQFHAMNQLIGQLRAARPDLDIPRVLD